MNGFGSPLPSRQGYPDLTDEMRRIGPTGFARSTTNIVVSNPFMYDALSALIMQAIDGMVDSLGHANDLVVGRFLDLVEALIHLAYDKLQYRERVLRSLEKALDQMMTDIGSGTALFTGVVLSRLLQIIQLYANSLVNGDMATMFYNINRQHDEAIMNNGFIYSQNASPQNGLLVGLFGNGAANGCGPFANYNALFQLSEESNRPSPSRIIWDLDMRGAFIGGGKLGTNPETLVDNLRQNGKQASIEYLPGNLDGRIRGQTVGILLYIGNWKTGYVHYVMFRHDGNGYLIYNWRSIDTEPIRESSMNAWLTKDDPYTSVALITIR